MSTIDINTVFSGAAVAADKLDPKNIAQDLLNPEAAAVAVIDYYKANSKLPDASALSVDYTTDEGTETVVYTDNENTLWAKICAAAYKDTPVEILDKLSECDDYTIQYAVTQHPNHSDKSKMRVMRTQMELVEIARRYADAQKAKEAANEATKS